MSADENEAATEIYTYTMNDDLEIHVHTDPSGIWHAGVSATVWDCSLILSKHFEKVFQRKATEISHDSVPQLLSKKCLNVVELGAGCSAIPSLTLAHLRQKLSLDDVDHFTLTDKGNALPLLQKSISGQDSTLGNLKIEELDWTEGQTSLAEHRTWDLIIASDLLAFPDLYTPLLQTLKTLSSKSTLVYLAYERRDFGVEIEFFRDLGEYFTFEMVSEQELDDIWRAPGEIYLYRAKLKP